MTDGREPEKELPAEAESSGVSIEQMRARLAIKVVNVFLGLIIAGFFWSLVGQAIHRPDFEPPQFFKDLMLAAISSALSVLGVEFTWQVMSKQKPKG